MRVYRAREAVTAQGAQSASRSLGVRLESSRRPYQPRFWPSHAAATATRLQSSATSGLEGIARSMPRGSFTEARTRNVVARPVMACHRQSK